mmetsp:Transcript_3541/g.9533  ORF Transcript_3541/g.9533 Transcript_3541/m.9533 type:complete len:202 (+) Transcript_3541:2274-2879(+)
MNSAADRTCQGQLHCLIHDHPGCWNGGRARLGDCVCREYFPMNRAPSAASSLLLSATYLWVYVCLRVVSQGYQHDRSQKQAGCCFPVALSASKIRSGVHGMCSALALCENLCTLGYVLSAHRHASSCAAAFVLSAVPLLLLVMACRKGCDSARGRVGGSGGDIFSGPPVAHPSDAEAALMPLPSGVNRHTVHFHAAALQLF